MRLVFLLGAGISVPAGLPSTVDLTGRVVSGESVYHHTDGTYYLDHDGRGTSDGYVARVLAYLAQLWSEVKRYYSDRPGRSANYEDLYYAASQLDGSESGEYENPAVQALVDRLYPHVGPLLTGQPRQARREWELSQLTREATRYIKDVVWRMLCDEPRGLDHLECISDACADGDFVGADIFTLNHDIHLETYLAQIGLKVADGFGKPVNGIRYWEEAALARTRKRVRLVKLHGSVNWFEFHDLRTVRIGIPLDWDIWHTKTPAGGQQIPTSGRPALLVGTFNKALEYGSGIYVALHNQFLRSLSQTSCLVVCGYGFGDKAINTRALEWLLASSDRLVVVIHPDPAELKRSGRWELSALWDHLGETGKVKFLRQPIERASWSQIKTLIRETKSA